MGDVAILKAWKGDSQGNLIYRKSARNFNQDMAKAAKYVVAEVEELVEDGTLEGENIHTPSIFVGKNNLDAVVVSDETLKPIERLANTQNKAISDDFLTNPKFATRVKIAKRAAQEISPGMYINLGIGMPTLVPMFVPEDFNITMQGENGILGLDGYPAPGEEDPDLVDPGKETVKVKSNMRCPKLHLFSGLQTPLE